MTRSLLRRLAHIFLALGVLCTSAAASPPLTSLAAFGAEDVQLWSEPLWLASADREAAVTAQPTADDVIPEGYVDQGPPAPEPVLKPYAPGDSVSIGDPNRGYLADGVQLDATDHMYTRPKRNWGTQEAVNAIRTAVEAVNAKFPEGTQKLVIGDLSLPGGGRFPPHKSHQSGRDADIGYYVKTTDPTRLMRVNSNTMDVPRTWTFVESLLADGKVRFLFMDYRLQRALYNHARDVEAVPEAQLARWFSYPKARVVRGIPIRHLKGHADHMHVRFFAPQAVANFKGYVDHYGPDVLKPVPVHYRVRKGDSLHRIARKFRLKVKQLREMNRFGRKRTRLRPGRKLVVGWRRPTLPGAEKKTAAAPAKKALADKRR